MVVKKVENIPIYNTQNIFWIFLWIFRKIYFFKINVCLRSTSERNLMVMLMYRR